MQIFGFDTGLCQLMPVHAPVVEQVWACNFRTTPKGSGIGCSVRLQERRACMKRSEDCSLHEIGFVKCTMIENCTVLYYTILYYTILYYTILYYTILYYTILYYTILYYTIRYYTILYHII